MGDSAVWVTRPERPQKDMKDKGPAARSRGPGLARCAPTGHPKLFANEVS